MQVKSPILPYVRTLFTERQPIGPRWLTLVLICAGVGAFAAALTIWIAPQRNQVEQILQIAVSSMVGFIAIALITLPFWGGIFTCVDTVNVTIKFGPVTLKRLPVCDIARVTARDYKPWDEFLGWGLKQYNLGNGWAYTAYGRRGVELFEHRGNKTFIGSQKADELAAAINEAMQNATPVASLRPPAESQST